MDEIWVLLDGGWRVETGGKHYPAGHADPGKWFSAVDTTHDYRLIVTERSYVMKIEPAEMARMLARGFAFRPHLYAGKAYTMPFSNRADRQLLGSKHAPRNDSPNNHARRLVPL